MCDSDLDYLGRTDFIPVSKLLYKELKVRSLVGSFKEWTRSNLALSGNINALPTTAQNLREVNKNKQIERIERLQAIESNEGSQM